MLGQNVRQLGIGRDVDEPHLSVLDHFMREVLSDVNVLGTLPATDDEVPPLDARSIVLVHRSRRLLLSHIPRETSVRCIMDSL